MTAGWQRIVNSLLDLPGNPSGSEPPCLPLEDGARAAFVEFHDANGVECLAAANGGDHDLAAALAKLRGAAPRIALVLALASAAESGKAEGLTSIDEQSMRAGIALACWFEGEARNIYRTWSAADASRRAESLEERILKILKNGTYRKITSLNSSH